ncbi:CAP domain-containing protein [Candidatus Contubernalis alkaliaceticus]|uniref:CAP domain-containing protein n=1 Tax=Candidatus Contubernalis alkaliaceticus TaxID=338645 RepID=UPI001F4C30B8|nr:CAP domain-containing protein [Candidatus Contubernalis alkalaceticus]UNC91783.1 hypothetical protein HUE98_06555 [Candidatus Contubernalis alkalaceticus]
MIPIDFFLTIFIVVVILIYFRNRNKLEKSQKEIKQEKILNYAAIISAVVLIGVIILFTNSGTGGWSMPFSQEIGEEEINGSAVESSYNLQEEQAVIMLINQERRKAGLDVLSHQPGLRELARFQALDLLELDYYDHVLPSYSDSLEMVSNAGMAHYTNVAVNFVKSSSNAGDVLNSMMKIPHQKSNLLAESFTDLGVGVVEVYDRDVIVHRFYIIIFAGI